MAKHMGLLDHVKMLGFISGKLGVLNREKEMISNIYFGSITLDDKWRIHCLGEKILGAEKLSGR